MLLVLFNEYRIEAQHIASVALALAIWRWGAGPERWLIAVFLATMVVPVYFFQWLGLGFVALGPYAWLYVVVDLVAAIAFVAIAVNANRNYPMWIAAFQLVAMGAHGARGLVDAVSPFAYLVLASGPSYCQLALIFLGFLRHLRRERRFGRYREWRTAHAPFSLSQP